MSTRFLIRSLLAALLFGLPIASAPASAQGRVEGHVSYDSERVAMTHVYARQTRSPIGRHPHLIVLITDREASPEVIASRQAYYDAARNGRIRGLLLVFENASNEARLVLFAPGVVEDTSVPDIFSRVALEEVRRSNGAVEGRVRSSQPLDFDPVAEVAGAPRTYTLDLRFSVPFAAAPQPSQVLTGEAARASPQTEAALEALQLIRTGTPEQVRARLLPNHPMWEGLAGRQAAAILAMAREMTPAPATFVRTVQRVVVYGDEAVVEARDSEGDSEVSLRREDGVWKLARSPIPND